MLGAIVTTRGALLWPSLQAAYAYAVARHTMYGTRQRVKLVEHEGRPHFRVVKAVSSCS